MAIDMKVHLKMIKRLENVFFPATMGINTKDRSKTPGFMDLVG